jgi:hypothetical protein
LRRRDDLARLLFNLHNNIVALKSMLKLTVRDFVRIKRFS